MHDRWNTCPHVSLRSLSPSTYSSRHTEQELSEYTPPDKSPGDGSSRVAALSSGSAADASPCGSPPSPATTQHLKLIGLDGRPAPSGRLVGADGSGCKRSPVTSDFTSEELSWRLFSSSLSSEAMMLATGGPLISCVGAWPPLPASILMNDVRVSCTKHITQYNSSA